MYNKSEISARKSSVRTRYWNIDDEVRETIAGLNLWGWVHQGKNGQARRSSARAACFSSPFHPHDHVKGFLAKVHAVGKRSVLASDFLWGSSSSLTGSTRSSTLLTSRWHLWIAARPIPHWHSVHPIAQTVIACRSPSRRVEFRNFASAIPGNMPACSIVICKIDIVQSQIAARALDTEHVSRRITFALTTRPFTVFHVIPGTVSIRLPRASAHYVVDVVESTLHKARPP
jgi:hypothetical protein